jgi:carboxylesterase type B
MFDPRNFISTRVLAHESLVNYIIAVRFAKTGDPNAPDLPTWPAYREPGYQYLNYSGTITTGAGFREAQVEFCARLLEQLRRDSSAAQH